ncbi:MAG: glycosyltransferase [Thermoplasmata archaeon]
MRVLFFWQFFPPDEMGLALASRGVALSKYLSRLGCEVLVFAPDFSGESRRYDHGEVEVRRVETYDSARLRGGLIQALASVTGIQANLLSQTRNVDPDIIVVSQPSYTLPTQALLIAKMLSIPCVLDMQDIFAQEVEFSPNRVRNAVKLLLEGWVLRNADIIVTVLPLMMEMAVGRHRLNKSKFYVLYNGFDSESLPKPAPDVRRKDIDLLHIGAPRAYYDSLSLIDALAVIVESRPKTNLVFLGCDRNPYELRVREKVESLGLDGNVVFEGLVLSRKRIAEWMIRSRMGVYTLYQGDSSRVLVGIKAFEYLATGLPIAHLGVRGGSMDTIIQKHEVGISAQSPSGFAEKVLSVVDDTELLARYSRSASKASSNYDWKRTIPAMYKNVLLRLYQKKRR